MEEASFLKGIYHARYCTFVRCQILINTSISYVSGERSFFEQSSIYIHGIWRKSTHWFGSSRSKEWPDEWTNEGTGKRANRRTNYSFHSCVCSTCPTLVGSGAGASEHFLEGVERQANSCSLLEDRDAIETNLTVSSYEGVAVRGLRSIPACSRIPPSFFFLSFFLSTTRDFPSLRFDRSTFHFRRGQQQVVSVNSSTFRCSSFTVSLLIRVAFVSDSEFSCHERVMGQYWLWTNCWQIWVSKPWNYFFSLTIIFTRLGDFFDISNIRFSTITIVSDDEQDFIN